MISHHPPTQNEPQFVGWAMVPLSKVLVPHSILFDVLAEEEGLPYWNRRSDKKFISTLMFGSKPNKHLFATLTSTESKELYKR